MSRQAKTITTVLLLLVIASIAALDYTLPGNEYVANLLGENSNAETENGNAPEGAVSKNEGPQVEEIAEAANLELEETSELSLLQQIVTNDTVKSRAILQDGDRAGSVTWIESPNVKDYFITLKDALLVAFSPDVTDLQDETLQEPGKPVRNMLTFKDPAISEERIVFIRMRERLYEFHIAEGKDDAVAQLIDALTAE